MTDTEKVIEAAERMGFRFHSPSIVFTSNHSTFSVDNSDFHQLLAWAIADRMNWGVEFYFSAHFAEKRASFGASSEPDQSLWNGPREELPMAVITKYLEETGGNR